MGRADPAGGDDRVARDERTGGRLRSGVAANEGGPRRRPLRGQRTEGVDVRRARRGRVADLRANRPGCPEAQGHQRADDPHRPAGCGAQAVRVGVRSGRPRLQRGVLQRCAGARRESRRPAQRGLAGRQRIARPRAKHVVAQLCRPVAGAGRGLPLPDPGGPGQLRHAGDGQPGAAVTRLDRAGAGRARRRGCGGAVGAEAVRLRGVADGVRTCAGGRRARGARPPGVSGPYSAFHLDLYRSGWFERYIRSFGGTIAGGTSEIQRNIIAQRLLGLPRN